MDLLPNDDEQSVMAATAQFVRTELPAARLHRAETTLFTPALRKRLAELGWYAMSLPSALGGAGFTVVEEALLFAELGRELGPTGVLHLAIGTRLAALAKRAELALELGSGEHGVCLMIGEGELRVDANEISGALRLYDCKDARYGVFLSEQGASLVDLSRVDVQQQPCLDRSITMGVAQVRALPVVAHAPTRDVSLAAELLAAAMLIGQAEATRDMIVEYAKVRTTFGKPIGAYQAVRHPCADMAARCELARSQLHYAAVALRDRREGRELLVHATKIIANDSALKNADSNIQLHGGIGVTDEHDAHLYLKRAHLLGSWYGSTKVLLERIVTMPVPAF